MMSARGATFALTITTSKAGGDAVRALRALLKISLRSFGLRCLDVQISELPAGAGADSERNRSAPTQEVQQMDMSEYAGSQFLRLADLQASGPFKAKILDIEVGKFGRPNLILSEGSILSLNATSCGVLIRAYGADSKDWLKKEIEVYAGEVDFNGTIKPAILMRPISPEIENKKPVTPRKPPNVNAAADEDDFGAGGEQDYDDEGNPVR